jgi:hypothetical protein
LLTVDSLEDQQWLKRDRIATCIQIVSMVVAAVCAVRLISF